MHTTRSQDIARTQNAEFVLPQPPRARSPLHIDREAPAPGTALLQRAADGVRTLGHRLQTLLECQDLFLAELRATLREMDDTVHEESRARMKSQVRQLADVLGWCETVQADLLIECRRAANGEQLVEVRSLCDDAVRELGHTRPGLAIEVHGGASPTVWVALPMAGDLVRLAIELAADRVGGLGPVAIELADAAGQPQLCVRGLGSPAALGNADALGRFRDLAAQLSVCVTPDALGPGGTGLSLTFPAPVAPATPHAAD